LPLALLRSISSLRYTSVLSTAFLCFLGTALMSKLGSMGLATGPQRAVAFSTTFLDFFNGEGVGWHLVSVGDGVGKRSGAWMDFSAANNVCAFVCVCMCMCVRGVCVFVRVGWGWGWRAGGGGVLLQGEHSASCCAVRCPSKRMDLWQELLSSGSCSPLKPPASRYATTSYGVRSHQRVSCAHCVSQLPLPATALCLSCCPRCAR
jgi:hypothetical protein